VLRLALAILAAALWLPAAASAAAVFGDRDVVGPTLAVDARGTALVTYRTQAGLTRHVLAWGAVNAIPHPTDPESVQQQFQLDYSGGWKSRHDPQYWRTFRNGCRRYDGPPLPLLTAACTAPDGSYWALQSWQRNLPMRGFDPWTPEQRAVELHLSHWTGPLPALEIYQHYTYGNANQGFFGRLLYQGQPVYGTRSPSATVADTWARNVYIDTFDSDYGPGWKHDTAINTHSGNGGFCYTFTPQAPPKGYPSDAPRGNGLGERYRVLVAGPGVTPIVQWEGAKLGARSAAAQAAARDRFDQLLGGDRHCAAERSS
jgi:hypothetical protein